MLSFLLTRFKGQYFKALKKNIPLYPKNKKPISL